MGRRRGSAVRSLAVRVGLLALLVPAAGSAQEDTLTAVAVQYLDAVYALDFQAAEPLLVPSASYRDPTGRALGGRVVAHDGRAEILRAFESSAADVRQTRADVVASFEAGDLVVLHLLLYGEFRGGMVGRPEPWLAARDIRAVTVLRFESGRILEHVDYVDYSTLMEQLGCGAGSCGSGAPDARRR